MSPQTLTPKEIRWNATKRDENLIARIVKRALPQPNPQCRLNLTMDLTAVHVNIKPLRLRELLDADDFNFWHDINGISACLDREAGILTHHFLPRFSRRQEPK